LPKVLIVEDDRTTVKLLKTLLELDGFEVASATSGHTGVEMAQAARPDIILVDYHLSDIAGVDLVKQVRAIPALTTVPIVVTSGLNVQDEALQAGANSFLVKPFEPGTLAPLFYSLIG
jgi:DNA-binding response OmpR family regulator